MKQIVIYSIVTYTLLLNQAFAQFILTPNGFCRATDVNQTYIVHSFDGQSKDDLFNKSIEYLDKFRDETLNQTNPEERVIKKKDIESGSIKFYGLIYPFLSTKLTHYADRLKHNTDLRLVYYMNIFVKDGKIRFDPPNFDSDIEIKGNLYWAGSSCLVNVFLKGERSLVDFKYTIFDTTEKLKLPDIKQEIEAYFNKLVSDFIEAMNKTPENAPKIDSNW